MKIEPTKDYKKPLYAIGVAAVIGATALLGTACGDEPDYAGGLQTYQAESSETTYAGGETIAEIF